MKAFKRGLGTALILIFIIATTVSSFATELSFGGVILNTQEGDTVVVKWDDYFNSLMDQKGELYTKFFIQGTRSLDTNRIVGVTDSDDRLIAWEDYFNALMDTEPSKRTPNNILNNVTKEITKEDSKDFKEAEVKEDGTVDYKPIVV